MKAFVTGITGQIGSYLCEYLLSKNYEVHGIIRKSSSINTNRINHLMENDTIHGKNFFTYYGDVTDPHNIDSLIAKIQPDRIYNLAAQSHVKVSFELPATTAIIDALGPLYLLESVKNHCQSTARIYQASTSELFGGLGDNMPQKGYTEESHFHPRSPYGCAKIFGYWITRNYREAYKKYACNGLVFNSESPRRGETFVTRKVTIWCGQNYDALKNGVKFKPLQLGNLNAFRDWGHAKDTVKAIYSILEQPEPDDYVVATGETHSVKDFINACFAYMSLPIEWKGQDLDEKAYCNGQVVVEVNPKYFRPSEVPYLLGDSTKLRTKTNWKPEYSFNDLVNDMMKCDMIS